MVIGSVFILCLCATAAWFAHWRNDLQYFHGHGNLQGADHLPVGQTIYFGTYVQPLVDGRLLDVHALTPVVTSNTARADIRLLVCEPASATDATIGSAYSLARFCSHVYPFRPGRYRLSVEPGILGHKSRAQPGPVSIIAAITPTTPGHVYVAGFRIRYSDGIRRGEQQTGIDMETKTTRADRERP